MSGTLGTGQLSGPLRAALASLLTLLLVGGCSAEEPLAEFLEREEKKYSQNDEELLIRHFFRDRRGGVFVDVGAFQWRKYSTTFYLEEQLGWSGLAIDANARLAAGYAKNRPNTRFYSYIVTDRSGTEEEFFLAGPISSTSKEHIEGLGREGREVAVETITLDELLDQAGIESIDFLSMDIEGGEPRALAGFDIERFRPKLICIEAGSPGTREATGPYFEQHGYERIEEYLPYDPVNWYYRPRD